MKHIRYSTQLLLLLFNIIILSSCRQEQHTTLVHLDIDFVSPTNSNPHFSWQVRTERDAFQQASVQVQIAKSVDELNTDYPPIWDSGKHFTSLNNCYYQGDLLESGQTYCARVRVWNQHDEVSEWSEIQFFNVPISYPQDWKAQWISYPYDKNSPLPVFKKNISLQYPDSIEDARLYIAAPGFYEAFIDGEKIGENVLDPGQTNYEDYTYYSVYSIPKDQLSRKVALSVMLGNGWYNQHMVWGKKMAYGKPLFIAQLVLHYKDGKREIIGTDASWLWQPGPVLFTNIYAGETFDANKVLDMHYENEADTTWRNALLSEKHPNMLYEQFAQPIKQMDELIAQEIKTGVDGAYVFDFGQNFAGWVRLKVNGKQGQKITIRLVEELLSDGSIDVRTTGHRATKVIQTQTYICKGGNDEVWEPQFTYFGFRYAEVVGLNAPPEKDMLTGVVLYSSMPKVGAFDCSEPSINKMHQLADWTLKSNVHSIPTDCPHREKCGWTGDAHALLHALVYNYDAKKILTKYMFDMRSSGRRTNKELYFGAHFHDRSIISKPKGIPTMIVPGRRTSGVASPDWGTAMVQLPWYSYLYYGDVSVLHEFYPDMKVWVDYIHAKNEAGIIPHGLGDWCPPGGNDNIDCPVKLSSTAFHILDLKLMSKTAKVLHNMEDASYYSEALDKTIKAFNAAFFDPEKGSYGGQTANVMALSIGVCPNQERQRVAQSIIDDMEQHHGFISTGIFGISRIFEVLAENGFEREVYQLLTKKGEYSFAYMWERYKATTLWEVLPISEQSSEMAYRSHNHPMQGGYDAWFYSGIGGIKPSEEAPGFKKIVFKPYMTNYLSEANVCYQSPYGEIVSSWKKEQEVLTWTLSIPDNNKADVYVPCCGKSCTVWVNGEEKNLAEKDGNFAFLSELTPGDYTLIIKAN